MYLNACASNTTCVSDTQMAWNLVSAAGRIFWIIEFIWFDLSSDFCKNNFLKAIFCSKVFLGGLETLVKNQEKYKIIRKLNI